MESYPIEFSAKGNNTHYHDCAHHEIKTSYAVCLNTIGAHERGSRNPKDRCYSEIHKGACPALAMRDLEIAAGHTLFYTPREAMRVIVEKTVTSATPSHIINSESYQRGYASAGEVIRGKTTTINKTKPKLEQATLIASGSMADVVNKMMAETIIKPKRVPDSIDHILNALCLRLAQKTNNLIGVRLKDQSTGSLAFNLTSPKLSGYTLCLFSVDRASGEQTYPAIIKSSYGDFDVDDEKEMADAIKALFSLESVKKTISNLLSEAKAVKS